MINMDEKLLKKLLHEPKEQSWFDFKGSLKLYQSDGKLVEKQRDEFLKDILGLANGNSHIIRKTKYLIIGADDKKFDAEGCRILHHVDYRIPSHSDISKWLASVCRLAVVGLESEIVTLEECNLFVITIPPTFHLHETIRELKASGGTFQKHTVFMRQDENTVPASIEEGLTIKHLKQLHRQEIVNPSANWIGAIAGGVVGFLIGGARIQSEQTDVLITEELLRILFIILGIFFGAMIGWFGKPWNETRYDWRYMTIRERTFLISGIIITIAAIYFFVL